jgi:hypothetical protein
MEAAAVRALLLCMGLTHQKEKKDELIDNRQQAIANRQQPIANSQHPIDNTQ